MQKYFVLIFFVMDLLLNILYILKEHNGRTYTIKGAYNLVEFIEMLKEKTGCKITL